MDGDKIYNIFEELKRIDASRFNVIEDNQLELEISKDSVNENKSEDFDDYCADRIRYFYRQASDLVKTIGTKQEKVVLADKYKINYYIKSATKVQYADSQFIEAFCDAATTFNYAANSFLNANSLEKAGNDSSLSKMASSFATMKDICMRLPSLTKRLTEKIRTIGQTAENEVRSSSERLAKEKEAAKQAVRAKIGELEKAISEYKKGNTDFILKNDEKMPAYFASPYVLCVGKEKGVREYSYFSKVLQQNVKAGIDQRLTISGYSKEGSANIFIKRCPGDSSDTFVENLIMRFLVSYPSKFKKVVAIQNHMESDDELILNRVMMNTLKCGSQAEFALKKNSSTIVSGEEVREVLNTLSERISQLCDLLAVDGARSIYEYNEKHPDNPQYITLVIVKGYPSGFVREELFQKYKNICENGNRVGIITVTMWSDSAQISEYGDANKALSVMNSLPAAYRLTANRDGTFDCNGRTVTSLERSVDFRYDEFFRNIGEELKKESGAIDFWSIQPIESSTPERFAASKRRKDFSKELDIPVGKIGGEVISIKLSTSGKTHVIINGATGSGKTAFLHTLILSAAHNYSPDELEIQLFDFKDGVGFSMYERKRLPHVRFIALKNDVSEVQDVLKYIETLMTERNNLITSIENVSTFDGYNDKVSSGAYPGKKKLSRMLIIIDEYQVLLGNDNDKDKCIDRLDNIVRKGRSAGMSLIMVSQDVPTMSAFTAIKQQSDHRIAFRSTPDNVGRLITGAEKNADELDAQKGLCFYEINGTPWRMMRTAFAGDDEKLAENIDKVVAQYKYAKSSLRIVGNPESLLVRNINDIPRIDERFIRKTYEEKGEINLYLGKYNLSETEVSYSINEDNTMLAIIGDYVKSKQIVTSVLCGLLRTFNSVGCIEKRVFVVDLCKKRRLLQLSSPLTELLMKQRELEDDGVDGTAFSVLAYYEAEKFDEMIEAVYDIYEQRKDDTSMKLEPVEIIILNAENIEMNRTMETLKKVLYDSLARGLDIYFTFQFESLECSFVKSVLIGPSYASDSKVPLKDLILLSSETDSDAGDLEMSAVFKTLSQRIGGKIADEYVKYFERKSLPSCQSFIVDDYKVSKFRHYQFVDNWVDSFAKELVDNKNG